MAKGKKVFAKQKKVVVFNEESRRDYLLGFRKRKKERRQRALDSIKRKELEQVRQMKQKKRNELIESLRKQQEEYDATQSDDGDDVEPQSDIAKVDATYEHPEHIVTVTTVCDVDLNGDSTTIGLNKELYNVETCTTNDTPKSTDKVSSKKQYEKKINKYNKKKSFSQKRSHGSGSFKFKPNKKRKK